MRHAPMFPTPPFRSEGYSWARCLLRPVVRRGMDDGLRADRVAATSVSIDMRRRKGVGRGEGFEEVRARGANSAVLAQRHSHRSMCTRMREREKERGKGADGSERCICARHVWCPLNLTRSQKSRCRWSGWHGADRNMSLGCGTGAQGQARCASHLGGRDKVRALSTGHGRVRRWPTRPTPNAPPPPPPPGGHRHPTHAGPSPA